MASAERAGLRVRATLREATGPNSQVTGASTMPTATWLVLDSRFTPVGWNMAAEYQGSSPWARA